jgi:hypothetical protein
MVVLALILIVLALLFGFGVLIGSTEPAIIAPFNIAINSTGAGIFLLGAVTMLVLLTGLWLMQAGARRARRRRQEVRSLRRAARSDSLGRTGQEASDRPH